MRRAKALREEARMTQEDAAGVIGLDRTAIAHLEAGRTDLSAKRLIAYAALLSGKLGRAIGPGDLLERQDEVAA